MDPFIYLLTFRAFLWVRHCVETRCTEVNKTGMDPAGPKASHVYQTATYVNVPFQTTESALIGKMGTMDMKGQKQSLYISGLRLKLKGNKAQGQ